MTIRPDAFDSLLSAQETPQDPYLWGLLAPLIWTGTKSRPGNPVDPETGLLMPDRFVVPVGFVTDYATVPRFMRWKVNPYGPYTKAAVLHDWLLRLLYWWWLLDGARRGGAEVTPADAPEDVRGILFPDGVLLPAPVADSHDVDGIFRRAMGDSGVRWDRRWTMWAGVRWGALFSRYRSPGRAFLRDLPRVLAVSVLMLFSTSFGAVGVLISLGFEKIANILFLIYVKTFGRRGAGRGERI